MCSLRRTVVAHIVLSVAAATIDAKHVVVDLRFSFATVALYPSSEDRNPWRRVSNFQTTV